MSASPRIEPVRVVVLVESLVVPEWVRWTVAQIDAAESFELAAIVPKTTADDTGPAGRRGARRLAYRLYAWLDSKVFGPPPALGHADLTPVAAERTSRGIAADVVVSFLPAARTSWGGPKPRHGVWTIVPMDDGRLESAPGRFWELRTRGGTATSALVALEGGFTRVIACDSVATDHLSLARTRNRAAWASARLVLRSLRLLQRDGGVTQRGDDRVESWNLPSAAVTVGHAARTAARGVAARSRTAWRRSEWCVAVRTRSLEGSNGVPPHVLPNPSGRYLADPFLIEVEGRHFLFVEDYCHATGRGAISVSEAAPDGTWSPPQKVLEPDYHVSYPFVFEHEGSIYMLPETGEAGRIELYRAFDFPHDWRTERVLLDGLTAFDATLHVEDGLWWLFANRADGPEDGGELWLFSSAALDGEWRPHPRNPIVTDPGSARPAGRLFRSGNALIRPGQDSSRAYGRAVVLNRVHTLSSSEYRETPVGRIEPNWLPGIEGTHTYTFDSRYECLDGYRRVRRLSVGA